MIGSATTYGLDGNCATCFVSIVVELETVASERTARLGHLAPYQFCNSKHLFCVVLRSTVYSVCDFAPCVFLQDHCLIRSPTGGVDEEVVVFLSHLKKVEMTSCDNLSTSLQQSVKVFAVAIPWKVLRTTSCVRVLSVSLTTPYKLLSCVSKLPFKAIYTSSTTLNR